MKKYIACLMGLAMVLGFIGVSSAAVVTDPAGDQLGGGTNTDITSVRAELTTRGDGQKVLKLSINATPNIGGVVMFEADVDNSTGTGGQRGMTGIPGAFAPTCEGSCPVAGCKRVFGTDIVVAIMNRFQNETSTAAITDTLTGPKGRVPGEWYATSLSLSGSDYVGFIRGFVDPTPNFSTTSHSYTLPWNSICVWVDNGTGDDDKFTITECSDPTVVQWQMIVFTDPGYDIMAGNADDLGDLSPLCMDIIDWAPNVGLVNGMDVGDPITYCEGNFDGNLTVDGLDAAKFKSDFGRGGIKNPCPKANYIW